MKGHKRSNRSRRTSPEAIARKATKRQELLDAADRAIRRSGPYVSMDEIATEAATAKPVLYRYFGDKGGLYQALAQRYVQKVMAAVGDAIAGEQRGPRARLAAGIDAYLELVEASPDVYRFLMHRAFRERPEAQSTVADFIHGLGSELAVVFAEDLLNRGLDAYPAETWARGIVGMVHVTGDWWLENKAMTRAHLVDHLVTLLWDGLGNLEPSSLQRTASP